MSPQRVASSLTSFHRSDTVRSVSAATLATGVSSFLWGSGWRVRLLPFGALSKVHREAYTTEALRVLDWVGAVP